MKPLFIFFFLSIFLAFCSRNNPEKSRDVASNPPATKPVIVQKNDTNQNKYIIKSAIITFETNIAGTIGKKIQYFDDYGKKEREDFYEDGKLKESMLTDGNILYKVRYADKTAFNMGKALSGTAYRFSWDDIPESQKSEGSVIKLESMLVAGKVCESYKIDNSGIITTFAGWGGICLYTSQQSQSGSAITKAVSIKENAQIDTEIFKLPKGIRVK